MGAELAVTPDPAILSPCASREDAAKRRARDRDPIGAKRTGLLGWFRSESTVAELNHNVDGEHSGRLAKEGGVAVAASAKQSPAAFRLRRVCRWHDLVVVDGSTLAKKHHTPSGAQANFVEPIAVTREPQACLRAKASSAEATGARVNSGRNINAGTA